jgi:anti-sigma factor RsiW
MNPNHDHGTHEEIGCLEAIEWLYAWLDGELDDPASIAQLEEHLQHCRSCWSRSKLERALTERIQQGAQAGAGGAGPPRSPESLQRRLRKLMNEF